MSNFGLAILKPIPPYCILLGILTLHKNVCQLLWWDKKESWENHDAIIWKIGWLQDQPAIYPYMSTEEHHKYEESKIDLALTLLIHKRNALSEL